MAPELILGGALVASLVLYFLFGGADFGGGVWDLLARGPRRERQRALIEQAIGPIWEANHVWLILAVVIVFTAFPRAFSALSIALHVPLTLFLIGIVFRGASFAFRSFEPALPPAAAGERVRARFGLGFSIASVVSPLLLGALVGAAASGRIDVQGAFVGGGYLLPWVAPFPLATGVFALAMCAYLAATYLCAEASEADLADDFRRRALGAGGFVIAWGAATLALAFSGAPRIATALTQRPWAWALEGAATVCAGIGMGALWRRRYRLARLFVPAQVALVLVGWAAAQFPYLVVDDLTIAGAAADARTLWLVVYTLAAGVPILAPCLFLLFRVFKSARGSA